MGRKNHRLLGKASSKGNQITTADFTRNFMVHSVQFQLQKSGLNEQGAI